MRPGEALDPDAQIPRSETAPGAQAMTDDLKRIDGDTECLAKLHHDNQMEQQMGALAKKNGASKQVKQFGELLIKDHGLADKQVTALAKKKNIDLTLPPPKDEAEKAEMQAAMDGMKRLETLKGDEFDREFAKMMLEDHQKAVTMVETTLKSTQDSKVQSLLNKLLPVLKDHLRIAEQVSKRVQSV
ncbi:MAG: DUF4142 domain-containing protein [Archangiaceae bacterium]|nr:DUF4142 domain-containing protein [Archangiaceae bacterium]